MLVATSNFLVPGPTFFVELAIFLLVLWVLSKYVLPPINRMVETRQKTIERNIADAADAQRRASELEEERKKALEEARHEARSIRDDAAKAGEQLRRDLQGKGEEEYQRLVTRAAAEIEAAKRRAAEELRGQVAGIVITVVEKVLVDGVTLTDQERLVASAIAQVEAQSAAGDLGALAGPGAGVAASR